MASRQSAGLKRWDFARDNTWVGLALAAASLLVVPPDWLVGLALRDLATQYRPWAGAILVLSVAMLIAHGAFACWDAMTASRRKRSELKALESAERAEAEKRRHADTEEMMKRLRRLTPPEKRVLARFFSEQTRVLLFDLRDGVVGTLIKTGILYRPVGLGKLDRFPVSVQAWAWDLLLQHPEMLDVDAERS